MNITYITRCPDCFTKINVPEGCGAHPIPTPEKENEGFFCRRCGDPDGAIAVHQVREHNASYPVWY